MFLILTVTTLLGSVLAFEVRAWLPHVSRYLISQAMKQIPKELSTNLRERWTSEIEADLASFHDRPLSGFVFALRVRLKGGRDLAAELALQQAIARGRPDPVVEKELQERSVLAELKLLKWNLDRPLSTVLVLLELVLEKIVALPPQGRREQLDELERALAHPRFRRAVIRFNLDLNTEKGLKVALVLRDLRREVERWSDRE